MDRRDHIHSHGHEDHEHSHDHIGHSHGSENIKVAFFINFGFTILEIVGGLLTNSIAILSDAVHDLGDSVSLLFSLIMDGVSKKPRNQKLTFGYKRYSLLGALVTAVVLISGSIFIIYSSIQRLMHVEQVHATGMFGMAVLGIVFNGIAALRLKKDSSLNSKVVFMHMLEDVLGWVAIFIVSIVMMFIDLPILDPILSLCISVFIMSRIIPTFAKIGRIFLQYKPDDFNIDEITSELSGLPEVDSIHDIHLWSLDGNNHIFTSHVVLNKNYDLDEIREIKRHMKEHLCAQGLTHSTLEFELENEHCSKC